MPNFCMTLSYDGTRYNGWQRQGNTPDTVQGRLETALSALLGQPVEARAADRLFLRLDKPLADHAARRINEIEQRLKNLFQHSSSFSSRSFSPL